MLMVQSYGDPDVVLARFNRLMQDVIRGVVNRNCFRPWEIALLLDIDSCELRRSTRLEVLRRYRRAMQRHMERGAAGPLKLSEYLELNRQRRAGNRETAREASPAA